MNLAARLSESLAEMDLALDPAGQSRLLDYLALLVKWNKTYNLTAIHDPDRMLTHHLLDSLAVLPYVTAGRLLDVGSGAGLPGIPLAIARPELRVTLVDAVQKKCSFMQQAAIELGLDNVEVWHGRVEKMDVGAGFEQIISRAFGELAEFVRVSAAWLAPGGEWLAMKGLYPNEELDQLKGARLKRDVRLHIPGLEAERHLIILESI